MDDEKISLRISKEELQALDAYLDENPEHGSRSNLIKNAVRAYLNRDAQVGSDMIRGGGMTIRLPPYLKASVDALAETMYNSPEEYICDLIRRDLDADGQKARDVRDRAVFAATSGISP